MRDHLRRHGVAIAFEGRRRAGQQIAVEFADPDNHQLEICWGIDQIADGEPSRPAQDWRPRRLARRGGQESAARTGPAPRRLVMADGQHHDDDTVRDQRRD